MWQFGTLGTLSLKYCFRKIANFVDSEVRTYDSESLLKFGRYFVAHIIAVANAVQQQILYWGQFSLASVKNIWMVIKQPVW